MFYENKFQILTMTVIKMAQITRGLSSIETGLHINSSTSRVQCPKSIALSLSTTGTDVQGMTDISDMMASTRLAGVTS